jgi:hypothetical protein
VERWTSRLISAVSSGAKALLAAFAAIIATAIASWVAGAPASLLASLAASAAVGSLAVLAVRSRASSFSRQRLIRSYLDAPDLGAQPIPASGADRRGYSHWPDIDTA